MSIKKQVVLPLQHEVSHSFVLSPLNIGFVDKNLEIFSIYNVRSGLVTSSKLIKQKLDYYLDKVQQMLKNCSMYLILNEGILFTHPRYDFREDRMVLEFQYFSTLERISFTKVLDSEFYLPYENFSLTTFNVIPFSGPAIPQFTEEYIALYGGNDNRKIRTALRIAQLENIKKREYNSHHIPLSSKINMCKILTQHFQLSNTSIQELLDYLVCEKLFRIVA